MFKGILHNLAFMAMSLEERRWLKVRTAFISQMVLETLSDTYRWSRDTEQCLTRDGEAIIWWHSWVPNDIWSHRSTVIYEDARDHGHATSDERLVLRTPHTYVKLGFGMEI